MITHKGPITDPTVKIKPSETLYKYINRINNYEGAPKNIIAIITKKKDVSASNSEITEKYLLKLKDYEEINNITKKISAGAQTHQNKIQKKRTVDKLLGIEDVRWLYSYIKQQNDVNSEKVYLHELMEGSEVILPENQKIPRNSELEKRCEKLRIQQENQRYQHMTKNVDNVRKKMPEDTLGYQMKEMNKQLIAILQFVVSVAAGFAFGFIGIEVFTGPLDFGFRLLLGIIFALIVALAELYFLAKKLNEDYGEPEVYAKKAKVD